MRPLHHTLGAPGRTCTYTLSLIKTALHCLSYRREMWGRWASIPRLPLKRRIVLPTHLRPRSFVVLSFHRTLLSNMGGATEI